MPHHHEKRILPYSAAQMFALVADIEHYPDFLPWCKKAVLRENRANGVTADLYVGAKGFQDRFTSIVTFDQDRAVRVRYGGGPLERLSNEWTFRPLPDGSCEVTFFVDFSLKSRLFALLMDAFFDFAFVKMMHAFEKRAHELYGKNA